MDQHKYILNYNSQKGVILLYSDINSLSAAEFVSEFKYLESACDEIEIRINSLGGSVVAGWSIISQILNSPTKTTGIVTGIAASISSIILLACDTVKMNDYGVIFWHNPYFSNSDGQDKKEKEVIEVFKNSLIKIYSKRTNLSQSSISRLMEQETYFDADKAMKMGIIDSIVETSQKKLVHARLLNMIEDSTEIVNLSDIAKILNKNQELKLEEIKNFYTKVLINNNQKMKEILNTLNLKDESTEIEVINSIKDLLNKAVEIQKEKDSILKELETVKNTLTLSATELDNTKSLVSTLKNQVAEYEAKEKAKKEADILNFINQAITDRKIKEEAKEPLINISLVDFDSVKNLIESLSPVIIQNPVKLSEKTSNEVQQQQVINNKTMIETAIDKVSKRK
jgi:ATP-dependent protease ClpP protease subunit